MSIYLWIAFGSALGGTARFALSGVVAHHLGETFPWGTLFVNIAGSFAIGLFSTLTDPEGRMFVGATTRQFVMTGVLGGFTTFSSFSLQTLALAREGEWLRVAGNAMGSFGLCLGAVWLGHILGLAIASLVKGS